MNSELRKFILKISLISIFMLIAGFIVFKYFLIDFYRPVYLPTLLFFYFATIAIHAWQFNMAKKDLAKFTRTNMIVTFLKLVVYSTFTIINLAIDPTNAITFVIIVMLLYIIFTITEVSDIMKFARSQNKNTN